VVVDRGLVPFSWNAACEAEGSNPETKDCRNAGWPLYKIRICHILKIKLTEPSYGMRDRCLINGRDLQLVTEQWSQPQIVER